MAFQPGHRGTVVALAASFLLFVTIQSGHAANCEGQKGRVIFEDDFTDDTGGWAHDPGASWDASFGKSGLTLHINAPTQNWRLLNITFTAREGDFCVEAVMPKAAAIGIPARVGLLFLANDTTNFYALMVGGDVGPNEQRGIAGLWRHSGGKWDVIRYWSNPKIELKPGSVVALRAVVKTNLITTLVNGVEVKKVRVQHPGNDLKFGVYVETGKPISAPGMTFEFKRYKVTAGE